MPTHPTSGLPPSDPPPHLADMLMYRLYQAWSQSNPVFVRLCEGRFGITRREWRILACAIEGGIMSSAELAAAAKLDLARTSRTLGALCQKGWLRRLHDSADRRVVRVEATAEGLARYQALLPEVLRLNELLVQDLNEAEVALLRDFLGRIEQRGRRMAEDNIVADKASRREGGTRRAQYA
ncbi:MarR family winged helix-turn-helix transcriptional regulator [Achromobacter spanius]|jgi:DNA-binding MarR family transcriptional regulator|uniref:MarR family winged helix-turn-helix transcriptional regulator n=2 Tax=Alcaligenaceae TaxID=506 RepID=A0AA42LTV2_9BURK|nr:MarR family winged helix-turn-helix transcriptional regulator [Achromobacter spanius]MDH0739384.1 MarR family winged helix-turn-helix transcriptional regulator [Achromobacter spanius]